MPETSSQLLERFFRLKIESYQFFGPTNFNAGFWEGLESLLLTYPATMWLSRMFHDRPREAAIAQALRIVDDNFGYNRLLGTSRQRMSVRVLASRGELTRLIAWYSR
jgi:lysine-N-methylase